MKSSKHPELAKQFIDFILSDAQLKIALSNSMYPANSKTELPAAFQYAPKTEKNLTLDAKTIEKNLDRWLTEWEQVMSK
jgi:thiamine transport system substrate-binding protein